MTIDNELLKRIIHNLFENQLKLKSQIKTGRLSFI